MVVSCEMFVIGLPRYVLVVLHLTTEHHRHFPENVSAVC